MQPSLLARLEQIAGRHQELARELADPASGSNPERFARLSQEYAQLETVVGHFEAWRALIREIETLEHMQRDPDRELRELARADLERALARRAALEAELRADLIPTDRLDHANVFLEIRAGTGGDEAALFAGDLFRMYARYAETKGWSLEVLSAAAGEHGGYREIISRIAGAGVYACLRFESGVHRVQRVPVTEASGRIHTSAATVAVLPEIPEAEAPVLNPADLKIDTYRSSGAGGQHVNKTESAIRITHLPSGIVVECQQERSQHKNRARAMALLQARLLDAERSRQKSEQAATRRQLVGSGDRSERIRTYNFPQGRLTDHRVNLTLYQLTRVLEGDLDPVIEPLRTEYQAQRLAELGAA